MTKDCTLLIYIPTFNRIDLLKEKIEILIPQINEHENVHLFISDNNSQDPQFDNLSEKYNNNNKISFTKRKRNTGIAGNILLAFLECDSDFLWILSDDDKINETSIKTILSSLDKKVDLIYLVSKIKGEGKLSSLKEIVGNSTVLRFFSASSMMGLISANIYNSHIFKENIEIGFIFSNTLFPHVAILLKKLNLKKNFRVCIIRGALEWNPGKTTYTHIFEKPWTNLLDLAEILKPDLRTIFIKKFLKDWAVSHYLPVSQKKGKIKKYFFYSLQHFKLSPIFFAYFIFFLIDRFFLKYLKSFLKKWFPKKIKNFMENIYNRFRGLEISDHF